MNKAIRCALIATSVLAAAKTISAQTILTDSFAVDSNQNNPNYELSSRQTGTYATSTYSTDGNGNVQVGNTTTDAGQPGEPGGNYLLVAEDSGVYNNLPLTDTVDGGNPLSFTFNLYDGVNISDPTDWMAFSIGTASSGTFPTHVSFAYLARNNGAVQVFDNGSAVASEPTGFVSSTLWTVILSGAGGVGSPFDGSTDVSVMNGTTSVYNAVLSQGLASGDVFGFYAAATMIGGVGNLDVAEVAPAPEPSEMALAAVGCVGALLWRRRKS